MPISFSRTAHAKEQQPSQVDAICNNNIDTLCIVLLHSGTHFPYKMHPLFIKAKIWTIFFCYKMPV